MMNYDDLLLHINQLYSSDGTGEIAKNPIGLTLGVVVDTDDPLQMGRLRIFCPSLNDNPKKIQHLPWSIYISPFGGSINNKAFTRGVDPANCTTAGATQYGFWAIPEQGAHVLVGCVDGDIRRRFYLGSAYDHQETHGVLTGRWDWDGGGINGPNSSTNSPMEPLHTGLLKAFQGDTKSREWRTRAAEYQVAAVREDLGQIPNANKGTYLDKQNDKLTEAEPDGWVKPFVGAQGYDWSGNKALGSFMNSRVYGFSSPGFHSFFMDDRAFNSRVRMRTTTGHQIILDDSNERIYIQTSEGNTWIEMDKSGNIDVYAKRRMSFHAEKDINFTTDETFRVKAKKGIFMYAGDNILQENLPAPPADGQIRIQAEDDIHVITKKNYRHLSFQDSLFEIGGKSCISIGDSLYLQVQNEINILTNAGDINVTSSANYNEMVRGNKNAFAEGTMTNASKGNGQMFTFDGKMDIGSQTNMTIKSMSSDVSLEAVGANSGKTGGVFQKSPESQHAVSSGGITASTNKTIKHKAAQDITMSNAVPQTNQDYPTGPPENIGDCSAAGGGPLPLDGYTGADLAARAAYNAGFRGDALVNAVEIAGAESTWNPGAIGDQGLQTDKWGPSVGMWQARTLNNPQAYTGIDRQRDQNLIGGSSSTNIQNNANFAYALSNGGTNFRPWSAFTSGASKGDQYTFEARRAVNAICNPDGTDLNPETLFEAAFANPTSIIEQCLADLLQDVGGNVFQMTTSAINMQSITDIAIKGALSSTTMFAGIYSKINEVALAHDIFTSLVTTTFALFDTLGPVAAAIEYGFAIVNAIEVILGIVGSAPNFDSIAATLLADIGLSLNLEDICSYAIPHFDPQPEVIFFSENHNQFDFTNPQMPASAGSTFTLD